MPLPLNGTLYVLWFTPAHRCPGLQVIVLYGYPVHLEPLSLLVLVSSEDVCGPLHSKIVDRKVLNNIPTSWSRAKCLILVPVLNIVLLYIYSDISSNCE